MLPPGEPGPASRHPLRARAHRAQDVAQSLLPGAALHRIRHREAVVASPSPRRQGRGRLGGDQHRVLHHQRGVGRDAVRLGSHVGRARREGAGGDVRRGASPRRARRYRALAHRCACREQRIAPARGRSLPDRERLRHGARAARDDPARHPARAGRLGRRRRALAQRRLRHRLRLRRAHVLARAIPVSALQPPLGRLRRLAPQPCAFLARDPGGGAHRRRRRLRDRLPRFRRPHGRPRCRPRREPRIRAPGRSPGRPLGRDRRLDRRGRSIRALRASSPRAGSSRAPGACARRPRSRSWASAG